MVLAQLGYVFVVAGNDEEVAVCGPGIMKEGEGENEGKVVGGEREGEREELLTTTIKITPFEGSFAFCVPLLPDELFISSSPWFLVSEFPLSLLSLLLSISFSHERKNLSQAETKQKGDALERRRREEKEGGGCGRSRRHSTC